MSKFVEKIIAGELPSLVDWTDYLIEFHAEKSATTSDAFRDLCVDEHRSSYAMLADDIALLEPTQRLTVLDLACGEGPLIQHLLNRIGDHGQIIGIDLSHSEIEIARQTHIHPNVTFHQAHAHQLPLAEASIDFIACHMALMLMRPMTSVVNELARVLKPGGLLSAIISTPGRGDGLWAKAVSQATDFLRTRYPKSMEFQVIDTRVLSREGITELFNSRSGFSSQFEFFDTRARGRITPDHFWRIIEGFYMIRWLPEHEKKELETIIASIAAPMKDSDGLVEVGIPIIKFSITKMKD